jgi:hypothetical protein
MRVLLQRCSMHITRKCSQHTEGPVLQPEPRILSVVPPFWTPSFAVDLVTLRYPSSLTPIFNLDSQECSFRGGATPRHSNGIICGDNLTGVV